MPTCIARKATRPMPSIGMVAPAEAPPTAHWPTSGWRLRTRCLSGRPFGGAVSDCAPESQRRHLAWITHECGNPDAVILSEATARVFRPAGFAGRAGAQSKDLLLLCFSMTWNMVKSRSLDSG